MLCYVRAMELKVEKNVTRKKNQLLQQSLLRCTNVSAELAKAENTGNMAVQAS